MEESRSQIRGACRGCGPKLDWPCKETEPQENKKMHKRRRKQQKSGHRAIQGKVNDPCIGKHSQVCPRSLDSYEKRLLEPICSPCPTPVTSNYAGPCASSACVFCGNSLYTDGSITDLHQKVAAVKYDSKRKKDGIVSRIGDRTRITAHKKCYQKYAGEVLSDEEESVSVMSVTGHVEEVKEDSETLVSESDASSGYFQEDPGMHFSLSGRGSGSSNSCL